MRKAPDPKIRELSLVCRAPWILPRGIPLHVLRTGGRRSKNYLAFFFGSSFFTKLITSHADASSKRMNMMRAPMKNEILLILIPQRLHKRPNLRIENFRLIGAKRNLQRLTALQLHGQLLHILRFHH